MLRNDLVGEVETVADLEGRKLAVCQFKSGCEFQAELFLEKGGLTHDDVELVELWFTDVAAALENGAVDAAIMVEPFYSGGVEQGLFTDFMRSDEFYPIPYTASLLYYSGTFREELTDVSNRFTTAHLRGIRDFVSAFV